MKRNELKAKATELGFDINPDFLDFIMEQNGVDVNGARAAMQAQIQTLETERDTLKGQVDSLTADGDKYKDYDTLKQELESFKNKEVNGKRIDYLKSLGCNDPDIVLGSLDWSKGTYNEEKKTYDGVEIDAFKKAHPRLFDEVKGKDPAGSNNNHELTGIERAFYANNPDLMPKNN